MHSFTLLVALLSASFALPTLASPIPTTGSTELRPETQRQTYNARNAAISLAVARLSVDVVSVTCALNAIFLATDPKYISELAEETKNRASDFLSVPALGFTEAATTANDVLVENFVGKSGTIGYPQPETFFWKLQSIIDEPTAAVSINNAVKEIGANRNANILPNIINLVDAALLATHQLPLSFEQKRVFKGTSEIQRRNGTAAY
ncbi:hypothetical protein GLAREA_07684 [Glarea lozoyensis ATCC 20868]|uniref:Uncharacterized protein n=1 Tax=Glarea lozoyensis (strain ATCC 20868 / MF5171) TaxID=1116229 RepID=S3D408_GLAL2|nr:uncharacterized protein GLAREA_07684 [Glarea lozoyensis ATCC 20868]EPE32550.1 hypothetical protein GLAREA_07684 [Glarea lozoyensis ATCC 20868]